MNLRQWWGPLTAQLSLLALVGCAQGEEESGSPPTPEVTVPQPADSLVLTAPGGVTVWLTEGRPGTNPAGDTCFERTLEIRRDSSRVKVPLLYTVSAPVLLDDSTFRAELARNCRPGDAYRVSLTTGRPTPIRTPD